MKDTQESLTKTITAAEAKAAMDTQAKKLLASKSVLAYILSRLLPDFHGLSIEEIASLIEDDIYVDQVPVDPGLTNIQSEGDHGLIMGLNTEQSEINEGLIRFDILFYVRIKDQISRILINLEAQNSSHTGYSFFKRAMFYHGRMISSQKERIFVGDHYDEILPAYSIWIFMNEGEDAITEYSSYVPNYILGKKDWTDESPKGGLIMIGLDKDREADREEEKLNRFLKTIFSAKLKPSQKFNIIEDEFNIPVSPQLKDEVNKMLGLGDMLVEDTWKEASEYYSKYYGEYYNEKLRKLQEEKDEQIAAMEAVMENEKDKRARVSVLKLNQAGHDSEFIASVLQMSEPEVNEILQKENKK